MRRMRWAFVVSLTAAVLAARCGDDPSPPSNPPPGSPTPPPTAANPCTTAAGTLEAGLLPPDPAKAGRGPVGQDERDVRDLLWAHRTRRPAGVEVPRLEAPSAADVGDLAVIQDDGTVFIPANQFDLRAGGLRFRPAGDGYEVSRTAGAFDVDLGQQVTLRDDDTRPLTVPFPFPLFGRTRTSAFLNSDGNVTFERGDVSTSRRGLGRLLNGPPRVAPFFADLDPTTGGRVFLRVSPDVVVATWCDVKGFDSSDAVTMQVALRQDGTIDIAFGSLFNLRDGIVALSPGETSGFVALDLGAGGTSGAAAAVGERFAAEAELDEVALAQRFYQTHADAYDQLVIWGDRELIAGDSFAFESTVANEVRGIGEDIFDFSREFGSQGRLRSVVVMGRLGKYPDEPAQRFLGPNSTLSLLGQESGHRWLAHLNLRDMNGRTTTVLLGRENAHWSFFFDSDASVMEGNDIEALGGGQFRTEAVVQRYGPLDQYAMGVRGEREVPTLFYVESPTNLSSSVEADSSPRVGVTFNGTRRDFTIQDIVTANGRRSPTVADAPKVHRQAFVYLVTQGQATGEALAKLERIRAAWEAYFLRATDGRMRLDASLR